MYMYTSICVCMHIIEVATAKIIGPGDLRKAQDKKHGEGKRRTRTNRMNKDKCGKWKTQQHESHCFS